MLDRAQIELYREQHYLLVEDVLDPALLDRLRRATHEMIERSRSAIRPTMWMRITRPPARG